VILAGERSKFVRLFVQIVGELLLFFGGEFAAKFFTFRLKFVGALNHGLVLCHVALLHRLISGFEVVDIRVVSLQIFVGRPAAQGRATL
jgi:hypothetical protein